MHAAAQLRLVSESRLSVYGADRRCRGAEPTAPHFSREIEPRLRRAIACGRQALLAERRGTRHDSRALRVALAASRPKASAEDCPMPPLLRVRGAGRRGGERSVRQTPDQIGWGIGWATSIEATARLGRRLLEDGRASDADAIDGVRTLIEMQGNDGLWPEGPGVSPGAPSRVSCEALTALCDWTQAVSRMREESPTLRLVAWA